MQGSWNSAYELQQNGFIVGGDRQTDVGQHTLVTGAFVTQSDGKIKNARGGKSRVESWGGGLYASLGLNDGWYTDATLKINRFSNDLSASMSDGAGVSGSWTSYGWGAALEGGRRIALSAAPVSLTPYVSLSGYQNQNREVRLSNGMQAHTGDGASLRLEAGLRTAWATEVAGKAVTPYLNLAAQQELVASRSVNINDKWDFSNDFTGTRARVGGGVNVAVTDSANVWAEMAYANGKHTETPVNANVGVRVSF
ncbi:hypothetical protein CIG19_11130 [Enterobacterales bacterium CwR94]|nr:hypothetical protein CIG19_11130 [Enterobacterales bacterium CwR94]